MKQKIMLIAGCSHAAGSEIDGNEDSEYNRTRSFGNQLSLKLGYKAINIAEPGSTNPTIARSILQWFNDQYNPNTMEVFVLVAWTEVTRMECPWNRPSHYEEAAPHSNYFATTGKHFLRVNMGWQGSDPEEKMLIKDYHKFMATNEKYLEIVSLNGILQIQYFLRSLNVNYLMCNTLHLTSFVNPHNGFYIGIVDQSKYYRMLENDRSFFIRYKELGYENPKAKYWHHGEEAHHLYSLELYNFMESQHVYSQMVQESN